jgi:uncharacterized protein
VKPVLQVFAKAPVPGSVKTRLIPVLGAQGAAQLHRLLLHRALLNAAAAAAAIGAEVELWCAPDATHPFFADCARTLPLALRTQLGADLGERMHGALADALARSRRPVLVGSDCPQQNADILRAACDELTGENDLVLQPAEDGGYALIGANRIDRTLFVDIEWGNDDVLARTLDRAGVLGLRVHTLAPTWDVDRPVDLARLRALQLPELAALQLVPT